ncbi:FG-GAP repeat domain-containing protein [Natrialbaceae archaeon GCM10025896]
MEFRHEVIDDSPPCGRLGICQPTDLTGNGRPDLIVGGMGANKLPILGTSGFPLIGRLFKRLETSIFWYENPGWERHALCDSHDLYVFGNALGDVTGNGRLDLIVGQGIGSHDIYWFEQPSNPYKTWTKHLVDSAFNKYHDLAFGDVDNDGEMELVGTSQQSEVIFYYDVPDDPRQSPWPEDCRHIIAEDTHVEGLKIVDIDGDGRNELIAGTSIYRQLPATASQSGTSRVEADGGTMQLSNNWQREQITAGWDWTRLAVDDLDGDGELQIIFSEGDKPELGDGPARVGWFDPPEWDAHILRDDLFNAHSLQTADFDGNGRPDIYVGEMGLGKRDDEARHFIFRNQGDGEFDETIIDRGTPTHEARAVDMNDDGKVDIVGKSYEPNAHVDIWYNDTPHPNR